MLRARYRRTAGGEVTQWVAAVDEQAPLVWVDVSSLPDGQISAAIEAKAAQVQASLNLEDGPVWRAAYFDLGAERTARLLVVVHHLVMDGVSWRILLEDFSRGAAQILAGQPVRFAPKTTAFRDWAARLDAYGGQAALRELDFWQQQVDGDWGKLPVEFPDGTNTEMDADQVSVSLSEEDTQFFLRDLKGDHHPDVQSVLLAALCQTLAAWSGSRRVGVELEGHGREDIFEDVDLSRTLGWFTTVYPFGVDLRGVDEPEQVVRAVQEADGADPCAWVGIWFAALAGG